MVFSCENYYNSRKVDTIKQSLLNPTMCFFEFSKVSLPHYKACLSNISKVIKFEKQNIEESRGRQVHLPRDMLSCAPVVCMSS